MKGGGAATANPLTAAAPSAPGAVFESESGAVDSADLELGPTVAELKAAFVETGVLMPEQLFQLFRAQGERVDVLEKMSRSQPATLIRSVHEEAESPTTVAELYRLLQVRQGETDAQMAELKEAPNAEILFKRRSEVPTNLHQATVFLAASDDPADATWALLLFAGGWLMVLLQCAVVIGVLMGTVTVSCASNAQCDVGTYCRVGLGRCHFCGDVIPLAIEVEGACTCSYDKYLESGETCEEYREDDACTTYNKPDDLNFVGFNKTATRMMCADPTGSLNYREFPSQRVLSWCDAW
jgi:hypothetical protein